MGLERLCADLRRHPVKAHTRHLFQVPLLTWFVLAPNSIRGGTLEAGTAYQLYPRSTSAKNPHLPRQLSLTFDLSCMGPKSSLIPSDKYHSQDLVHGIGENRRQLTLTVLVERTLRKKGLMRWLVRLLAVACATWLSPLRSVCVALFCVWVTEGWSWPENSIIHNPFSSLKMSKLGHLVDICGHFMEFNDR